MAESFADLGLATALVRAAEQAGYDRPSPLQDAAVPLVRRGANVVLNASSGAGVTATFGLGLIDRLAAGGRGEVVPRALVLAPTPETAERITRALARFAAGTDVTVRQAAAGWRHATADVLVTTPTRALQSVQESGLKTEGVESVVVVAADEIHNLGDGATLKTLTSLLSADAQRVVIAGVLNDAVSSYIETQVRRPMTVPARPADRAEATKQREPIGQIGYMVLSESDKADIVARLLDGVQGGALVLARSSVRASMIAQQLEQRGITDGIRTAAFGNDSEKSDRIISYDVPFSAADLRAAHETGGTVLITPAELPHLKRIAAEVPFTLKQRRARTLDESEHDAFRAMVRNAIATEDIGTQMLLLDPLLEDYSALEIAAALSALVRKRAPVEAPKPARPSTGGVPREAMSGGMARLFLSVGTRDNIRPGDLVGAITGESNIRGEQVGRVDIRESFSVVEVNADVADKVIRALNGTTMKGRSLRVDFDRKPAGAGDARRAGGKPPARGGARGGAGPRRRSPE